MILNFQLGVMNYGLLAPGVAQIQVHILQITACMVLEFQNETKTTKIISKLWQQRFGLF